jgi:hypothetical protein
VTTGALRSSGRPQRPRPPLAKSKPSSPHPKLTLIKAVVDGKLPAKAPVVTSAANPHYQKHFDKLFAHAQAGEWDAVCDDKITGSNSYSKMVRALPPGPAGGARRAGGVAGDGAVLGCARVLRPRPLGGNIVEAATFVVEHGLLAGKPLRFTATST